MVAYIEVPFGTWAKEIGPEANIELLVGNDIMVLTNAALVNAQEGGRSSLKLTPVKKEGSANGNGGTLCSLIPHFMKIESVPLSVRLGRDETYIIENIGLSDIAVIGHYVGYISVPSAADDAGRSTPQTRPGISEKKRKRGTEGQPVQHERVAFKTASGSKAPIDGAKGTQSKKDVVRNATASTSRRTLEDDEMTAWYMGSFILCTSSIESPNRHSHRTPSLRMITERNLLFVTQNETTVEGKDLMFGRPYSEAREGVEEYED
ncbi:hypothetical protein EDD18DRAFT_1102033 [Armillaria luteobubalina]|uniref:Nucleoplasmin-like domain-containing protein n=1 Tax=Armillaria luteobubalina TaxID=153913 RepID=A0AA39QDV8_9AGAR|nr:hypothetical protein EDD18DRAFT_1102033 [Armillaria luteobubalina]